MKQMHRATGGKEKLYMQAFREVRSYIIRNGLRPGDLLPSEQTLCAALNVSRNVLREAIKSLELMGMVEACPGRGTAVKAFNLDFIFQNVLFFQMGQDEKKVVGELLSLRRTLELSFMPHAFFSVTEEDVAHLKELLSQIRERGDEKRAFGDIDREFHMTLYRRMDNGVLESLMQAVWAMDETFDSEKKNPHLSFAIAKHAAIVTALEMRDYDRFAKAMQAHFSSGKYLSEGNYEEY